MLGGTRGFGEGVEGVGEGRREVPGGGRVPDECERPRVRWGLVLGEDTTGEAWGWRWEAIGDGENRTRSVQERGLMQEEGRGGEQKWEERLSNW